MTAHTRASTTLHAGQWMSKAVPLGKTLSLIVSCCRSPKSGSFIRLSSKLSFGSSFLEAIKAKYAADIQPSPSQAADHRQYTRKNLADIEVEAPNMAGVIQRMSQLHKLRQVGLGGWKRESDPEGNTKEPESFAEVASAFGPGEREGDILRSCPSIRGLDLSRSLLPSWREVSRITAELHQLESLLLHFNRFETLSASCLPIPGAFSQLFDLRIDGTGIGWSEMLALAGNLPRLESLQMGSNGMSRLDGTHTVSRMSRLKLLNLDGNVLDDWQDVWESLAACPNLERLILSSNRLGTISNVKRDDEHAKLQHISLWDNPVSSWSDLDALDACVGGLKSLVLGGDLCGLTTGRRMEDVRPLAIARLAALHTFNNASIRPVERRDAELFYLSSVVKEGGQGDQAKHPRWAHLSSVHGAPQESSKGDENAGTLRSKLLSVEVHLSSLPPSATPPHVTPVALSCTAQSVQLKLLTTTPLRLLMSKMARSFSLAKGVRSIQSVWALLSPTIDPLQSTAEGLRRELRPQETATSGERIVFEMDSLERDLQGYNFSPGDQIVLVLAQ